VHREDLDLKNHLAGHQRKLMKVSFDHVQRLSEVKAELMPAIQRNRGAAARTAAYESLAALSGGPGGEATAAVRPTTFTPPPQRGARLTLPAAPVPVLSVRTKLLLKPRAQGVGIQTNKV
jgi:hypothetical protein